MAKQCDGTGIITEVLKYADGSPSRDVVEDHCPGCEKCTDAHRALLIAKAIGCVILRYEFNCQPLRFAWRYGSRGSEDQHGAYFQSATEAAHHFLRSGEGERALKRIIGRNA